VLVKATLENAVNCRNEKLRSLKKRGLETLRRSQNLGGGGFEGFETSFSGTCENIIVPHDSPLAPAGMG
jgi:hypothetical protein